MKILQYLAFSLLLLATGCKSAGMFSGLTRDDRDEQSTYATDATDRAGGLPQPTQARPNLETVKQQVTLGQSEIASWYKDKASRRLDTARQHFEQALRQDPSNIDAHHGLAIVADLQSRFAEAAQHYRQALAVNPNSSQILGDFGYSYLLQNKLTESERLLQQALENDPGNANALKHLGDVYARQGKTELAASTYRRVLNKADVERALAENSPQATSGLAVREDAPETRPLLSRLRPNPNRSDDVTAQIQQRMEQARLADQLRRRDQQIASARTAAGDRPAWANEPPSPYMQPPPTNVTGAPLLSEEEILKRRLAQIDREPTQNIPDGPVIIEGPRSETTPLPGAESITSRPRVATQAPANFPQDSPNPLPPEMWNDSQPIAGRTIDSGPVGADLPDWARSETEASRTASGTDPLTRPWGSVAPNTSLAAANGVAPEAIDRAYYEQPNAPPVSGQFHSQQLPASPAHDVGGSDSEIGQLRPLGDSPAAAGTMSQMPPNSASGRLGPNSYEEAARAAARLGMGLGGGTIFTVPQSAPRASPGTSSLWNGAEFPPPDRALPTNVPPQDLSRAYQPQAAPNMAPTAGTHGQYPAVTPPMRNTDQFGTATRYDESYRSNNSAGIPAAPSLHQYEAQRRAADDQLNAAMNQAWVDTPLNTVTPARAEVPVRNTTVTPQPWPYASTNLESSQIPPHSLDANRRASQRFQQPPVSYPPNVVVPKPYPSGPTAGEEGTAVNRLVPNAAAASSGSLQGVPPAASSSAPSEAASYGLPQIVPGR